jgi:hypothetical protein
MPFNTCLPYLLLADFPSNQLPKVVIPPRKRVPLCVLPCAGTSNAPIATPTHSERHRISSLPLKPGAAPHDRHTLIHHPFPHAEVFIHPVLQLLAFGDLV